MFWRLIGRPAEIDPRHDDLETLCGPYTDILEASSKRTGPVKVSSLFPANELFRKQTTNVARERTLEEKGRHSSTSELDIGNKTGELNGADERT